MKQKILFMSILGGVCAVMAQWLFLGVFIPFFNGMGPEVAAIVGVGFFLAFELAVCTGLILMNKKDT